MILQAELTGERLASEIADLIESPEAITVMESAAKQLGREDAAEKTVDIIEELKASV
jgi:UDP-N-acetylglucosamine:LPS N-acetylglucosamine transferase